MNKFKLFLVELSCLVFVVLDFLPWVQLLPMYNIVLFSGSSIFTLLLFSCTNRNSRKKLIRPVFVILMIMLITTVSDNYALRNGYLTYSVAILLPVIYSGLKGIDLKLFERILLICLPIIAIICALTIFGCLDNPYASRRADLTSEEGPLLIARGVGGYSFIYGLVFLVLNCILLFFSEEKFYKKLIYLVFSGIASITILFSNFTTAVLGLLIGVSLLIIGLIRLRKLSKLKVVMFALIVLVIAIAKNMSVDLSSGEGRIAKIFANSNESVLVTIVNEFMEDRGPFIQESWRGICNSPLLGNALSISYQDDNIKFFGHHSFALDSWSLFGIFGMLFIYFMLRPILDRRKYIKTSFLIYAYGLPLVFFLFINNYCYFMLPTFYLFGLYSIDKFDNIIKNDYYM